MGSPPLRPLRRESARSVPVTLGREAVTVVERPKPAGDVPRFRPAGGPTLSPMTADAVTDRSASPPSSPCGGRRSTPSPASSSTSATTSGPRRPTCPGGTCAPSPPTPRTSRRCSPGAAHEEVEIGDAPHARGMMGQFTEQGVVARRDETPDDAHHRDPRVARPPATRSCWPTRPPTRRRPRPGCSARSAGPPGCCCATGRSTCGCTSRTCAARSTCRATSTPRRRSTPPTTSWRACPSSSASGRRRRPGSVVRLEVAGHDAGGRAVGEDGRGRVATSERRRADRRRWPWTARPSSCWPVGAASADAGRRRGLRRRRARRARRRRAGRDPVSEAAWTTARHRRPDRSHRRRHRSDAGRARLPHRPRAGPPRRPRRAGRTYAGQARRGRRGDHRPRCPAPRSSTLVVDLSDLASVREAAASGRRARPDPPAGQQRRHHGHPAPPHGRRAGVADGDQPLRARSSSPACCSTSSSRRVTAAS